MSFVLKQCAFRSANRFVMRSVCSQLVLGFTLTIILTCAAYAQDAYCPKSISVKQTAEKVPDGWTAGQQKLANNLAGITFYDGPPEQEASLAYDNWTRRNGLAYGVWHFTPNSSPGTWLSCRYAATNVVLSKKLPASISECTVTYNPKVTIDGNPEIQKIACH